jgi:hypothetical protein
MNDGSSNIFTFKIRSALQCVLTNGATRDSLESIRVTNGNPRGMDQWLKDFNDMRAFKRATAICR